MEQNEDSLNTGKVVEEIPEELFEKAAKDFSEGNKELEDLLLYCFRNNIKTIACCAGHKENNSFPYISFKINDKTFKPILRMIKAISNIKDVELSFTNYIKKDKNFSFTIYSHGVGASKLFNAIKQACESKEDVNLEALSYIDQKIISVMMNHSIDREYFRIDKNITQSGSSEYILALPTTYKQYVWPRKYVNFEPLQCDAFVAKTKTINDVNEILNYISQAQNKIQKIKAYNTIQKAWENSISYADIEQINSNPKIADKIKVDYLNKLRQPLIDYIEDDDIVEESLSQIIISLDSDEEKLKQLKYIKSNMLRSQVIASLKSDTEKIKSLNSFTDESIKARIIATLHSDNTKLREIKNFKTDENKSIVLSTLDSDRRKLKVLSKISDPNSKLAIITSLSSDNEKLKRLDDYYTVYDRVKLISSLKSDEEKLKLVEEFPELDEKIRVISTLQSDEEKLKWLDRCFSSRQKATLVSSLNSDEQKLIHMNELYNDFERFQVLLSLQSDEEKLKRLDGLTSSWQKISLISSLKSNEQKLLHLDICGTIFDTDTEIEYKKAKELMNLSDDEKIQRLDDFDNNKIRNWIIDSFDGNALDLEDMPTCYELFNKGIQMKARTRILASINNPTNNEFSHVPDKTNKRGFLLNRALELKETLDRKIKSLTNLQERNSEIESTRKNTGRTISDD